MKKSDKDKMLKNGIQSLVSRPGGPNVLESMFDKSEEFVYLPVADIKTEPQPRKTIDTDSESFKGLVESIREKGVLEPVLVRKLGKEYILISGERRVRATREAGVSTIPARIFRDIKTQDILALQLIENLNREDLDPIDEANAYLEYYKSFDGNKKVTAQDLINALYTYKTRGGEEGAAPIIGAMVQIFGSSPSTLGNLLSLVMLKTPLQEAIRERKLGLTQGYVLAENRDHPRLDEIAAKAIKEQLTVEKLRALFQAAPKAPVKPAKDLGGRPVTFKSARKKFSGWKQSVLKSVDRYSPKEVGELVKEVESLLDDLKGRSK